MRTYTTAIATALILATSSLISGGPAAAAVASDQSFLNAPPATTGSCVFKKTEISASNVNQTTSSTTLANLGDGGSITFNEGKSGCVAGTFYANVGNNTDGDNVHLQIFLDNVLCGPLTSDYVFANSGVDLTSHTVSFLCGTSVAVGSHTLQIQWAVGGGGQAQMFQHALMVSHR